jgi:hypothetical protein
LKAGSEEEEERVVAGRAAATEAFLPEEEEDDEEEEELELDFLAATAMATGAFCSEEEEEDLELDFLATATGAGAFFSEDEDEEVDFLAGVDTAAETTGFETSFSEEEEEEEEEDCLTTGLGAAAATDADADADPACFALWSEEEDEEEDELDFFLAATAAAAAAAFFLPDEEEEDEEEELEELDFFLAGVVAGAAVAAAGAFCRASSLASSRTRSWWLIWPCISSTWSSKRWASRSAGASSFTLPHRFIWSRALKCTLHQMVFSSISQSLCVRGLLQTQHLKHALWATVSNRTCTFSRGYTCLPQLMQSVWGSMGRATDLRLVIGGRTDGEVTSTLAGGGLRVSNSEVPVLPPAIWRATIARPWVSQ